MAPPPPTGGSATTGGSGATAGSTTGGSAGMTTGGTASGAGGMSGGSGGGSATGADPGGACKVTADCRTGSGAFCSAMVCKCSSDKPDVCGATGAKVCTMLMTDPDNCGTCGTKCDAGATCVAGKCGVKPTELLAAPATPTAGTIRLAIQGADLYWVEPMSGKVRTIPVAGGTAKDIAAAQTGVTQIAANAKGVYWMIPGTDATTPGKVMKLAIPLVDGAQPVVLKTATDKVLGLTAHGDYVYYSVKTDVHQISSDPAVTTDVVVGTAVNYDKPDAPVIDGEPVGLAVNDTVALWTTGVRNGVESHTLKPNPFVVLGDTGYVKLAKSVGALLLNGDASIDATNGYWADGEKIGMDTLVAPADAIAGDNSSHNKVLTAEPSSSAISSFTTNATSVYFAAENGLVFRHSLVAPTDVTADPMPPVPLARDQKTPSSVVVDATKVYWATSDGAIRASAL